MKKITTFTFSALVGVLMFAMPAFAATTAVLTPASVNVAPDTLFTIVVRLDPHNTANYTEKIQVTFPADLLEVISFTQPTPWIALTQPTYDMFDNANGVLIKTAGYPQGFSTDSEFGTITFHSKKIGSGTISFANGSIAYEAQSQSAITGNNVSVVIKSPTVTTGSTVKETPKTSGDESIAPPIDSVSQSSQTANAFGAGIFSHMSTWLWILGIIILIILAWLGYREYNKKKEGENKK